MLYHIRSLKHLSGWLSDILMNFFEDVNLLNRHDNHTELAYILELPETPGPTQKEFEIKKEASYIISVKNPDIQVSGFAAFLHQKRNPIILNILRKSLVIEDG